MDRDLWRLEVVGHVERSRTYAFEDLQGFPQRTQLTTLMCISNHVSAGLIEQRRVARRADGATCSRPPGSRTARSRSLLRGADGYTDTFAIEKALDPDDAGGLSR